MNTDVLCEILFRPEQEQEATRCLDEAFTMFRTFEQRYSRFQKGNELWELNQSEKQVVSEELFDILTRAQYYYKATHGLFDPSILPALEQEGYPGATSPRQTTIEKNFSELTLEPATRTVTKPHDLLIDLGGIGKGYIVDRVASFLNKRFENVLVDAGGDISARGGNRKEGYPYWAIDVEHPERSDASVVLLLLSDMSVATSGRNRRHWVKDGQKKHHLIDPATGKSARPDFLSVTVIAQNTVEADIYAKTVFIAGHEKGPDWAEGLHIPTITIDNSAVTINQYAKNYVWHL